MSISDVAARMQQLQAQFALLHVGSGAVRPTTTGPDTPGATAFAAALADVSAPASTDGVSAMPGAVPVDDSVPSGGTAGTAGRAVVDEARKYLGVPYAWGGTDPKTGLDCSGLVQLVYSKFGVDLPRVSYQQATSGKAVGSLAEARPGDLLAFGSPVHHIAIYVGDGKMIEAPRPGLDVRVIDVYEKPTAIRRVLPDDAVAARTAVAGGGAVSTDVPYAGLFAQASAKYGVPASLLAAVARQESGYNAQAVSPAGARGLMQLMPATARGLGVNPDIPAQAVDGAARLLRDLIGEFDRVDLALAAYNAGPGAVHRYQGIPPYRETQQYVPAVLGFKRQLENA